MNLWWEAFLSLWGREQQNYNIRASLYTPTQQNEDTACTNPTLHRVVSCTVKHKGLTACFAHLTYHCCALPEQLLWQARVLRAGPSVLHASKRCKGVQIMRRMLSYVLSVTQIGYRWTDAVPLSYLDSIIFLTWTQSWPGLNTRWRSDTLMCLAVHLVYNSVQSSSHSAGTFSRTAWHIKAFLVIFMGTHTRTHTHNQTQTHTHTNTHIHKTKTHTWHHNLGKILIGVHAFNQALSPWIPDAQNPLGH